MSTVIAFVCIPLSIFYIDVQTVTLETQQCPEIPVSLVTAVAMWTPWRPGAVIPSPENAWDALGTPMAPTVRGVPTGSMGTPWLRKTAAVSVWPGGRVHYLSPCEVSIHLLTCIKKRLAQEVTWPDLRWVSLISYSKWRSDGLESMCPSISGESGPSQSVGTAPSDQGGEGSLSRLSGRCYGLCEADGISGRGVGNGETLAPKTGVSQWSAPESPTPTSLGRTLCLDPWNYRPCKTSYLEK